MKNIKYFLYARKSSESEDRQVASIESQIDELKKLAEREGLEITKIFSEAQSAKAPGRPVFNQMMDSLSNGNAHGIICWKLDRLARNFIDGGRVIDMLQHGLIESIQTYERKYAPTDNVLMMAVEFGMANQFIRDLSANTKRGLRSKAEKGWLPCRAPIGYQNEKFGIQGEKKIIKDPQRFSLVRKMWDLLLEKQYSIDHIYRIAVSERGLTLSTGKKPCRSKIYHTFVNPFYYGYFYHSGIFYKGSHEPMITEEEFDRAQVILGNRMKPKPRTHHFAFTGMIRCGECGAMITAEHKTKHQKNGNEHNYTYYRCAKSKDPKCFQKCTEEKELEKQIVSVLRGIEIPPEFHDWAMEQLRVENEKETSNRDVVLESQRKAYDRCLKKIDTLINMRANSEISETEFTAKKAEFTQEKMKLEELLRDSEDRADKWLEKAEKVFSFARDGRRLFETGTLEDKKQILACLGSNLILKDRLLTIEIQKPLLLIKEMAPDIKSATKTLEPATDRRQLYQVYSKNPLWGG